jgi:hypothetical protein
MSHQNTPAAETVFFAAGVFLIFNNFKTYPWAPSHFHAGGSEIKSFFRTIKIQQILRQKQKVYRRLASRTLKACSEVKQAYPLSLHT